MAQKRGKVFTWPVSPVPSLKPKGILPRGSPKCALSAKVRLALGGELLMRFLVDLAEAHARG